MTKVVKLGVGFASPSNLLLLNICKTRVWVICHNRSRTQVDGKDALYQATFTPTLASLIPSLGALCNR